MKTVVIGAGASGMVASLLLSKNANVTLLDSNDRCGKKILLTGNGRCNYWNKDINIDNYYTSDACVLSKILTKENINNTYQFLESLGIYPRIKNNLFYPYSNSSNSIREIFEKQIKNSKINFKTNFKVKKIIKQDNLFKIYSDNEVIEAEKVIIATGSKAYPKTGSDGSCYDIVSSLGHSINDVKPALVPLVIKEKFKILENVRCEVLLTLFIDNKKIKEEVGEIQFTKLGISGICTFNISSLVSSSLKSKKKTEVKVNFLPFTDNVYNFLEKRNELLKNKTIEEQLESLFNYKLMFTLLEQAHIDKNSTWESLNDEQKKKLCSVIQNFNLTIIDTESFDKAQVCTGGIPMKEINPLNMESKIVSNLYLIGEILDTDGICGGFNLAFAFITGYLVGCGIHD